MLQISKPLSGVTPNALINKSFSLTQLNRYFKFDEEDSYVRVFSKHHDRHLPGRGPLVSNHVSFRYDSTSLLRQSLKSSVDADLQNVLNSFLVSTIALTATRFQAHEHGGRQGLRSGLLVEHVGRGNQYHYGGPYPIGFEQFSDSFINYYNNSEDTHLRGTITSFSPRDIDFHKPEFSCGSYKGSARPDAISKAHHHLIKAQEKFEQFFKSLRGEEPPSRQRYGRNNTDSLETFQIRIFQLTGTENSTSYGRGESTQAIPQQEPIRDKDGLYAIMKVPREANIRAAQESRGEPVSNHRTSGITYDPIYSNLFNAYADNPELGDSFLSLSGCIIIKLNSFLNKQAYKHVTEFPTIATMSHHFASASLGLSASSSGYGSARALSEGDYQTFGPLSHVILPESFYADLDEAQKFNKYGPLPHVPEYTKQELLSLREPETYINSIKDPNYFVGECYQSTHQIQRRRIHHAAGSLSSPCTKSHNFGSRIFNEQAKQFYCWVALNDPRYMQAHGLSTSTQLDSFSNYVAEQLSEPVKSQTAAELARINGQYIFGFGSIMQEPIKEQTLLGYLSYNMSDDKKFRDVFSFYSPFPLNQEKLYTEKKQSILLNHKVTKDITKRGKGYIYVDQENIAYCPLSGEALKVRTYLKHSNYNNRTPTWSEPSPAGDFIS